VAHVQRGVGEGSGIAERCQLRATFFIWARVHPGLILGRNGAICLSCIVRSVGAILTIVICMLIYTTFRLYWPPQNVDYSTVAKTRGGRERRLRQIWSKSRYR